MNIGTLIASLGVDTKGLLGAEKDFAKFGKNIGKQATKVGKNLSLKLTAPILLLGGIAAKTAIDFESAFTGVRKTVEATEKEFAVLKKGLKAMALEIPISTEELFGLGEAAGQLGIKQKDILKFTKVMADLGATTNLEANEAATSLARFANITKLSSDDFDKLGSTIVALGNNLATTEAEIVDMSMRLAGAGTVVGMTQAQILSLAGALSSVGIRAEAGGTAFSKVMKEINKKIGTGSKAMKLFATVSGKSVAKFEKQWKENAAGALIDFTEGLARAQAAGKNVNIILEDLGLSGIRISDSLLRAAGSGDLFREALKLGSKAWKENTALTKEANLRYKTSASQLKIARNQVAQLAESFGAVLVPAIIKVTKFLKPVVTWLKELDESTKTAIVVIGGLTATIGPLLIALGMMVNGIKALHIIKITTATMISFVPFVQSLTIEFGLLRAATLSASTAFSILGIAIGGLILGYAVGTWASDWVWGLDKIKDKMKEVIEEQTKLEKKMSRKLFALGFADIKEFNKAVKSGLMIYNKVLGVWEKTADVIKKVGEERIKAEKEAMKVTEKTFKILAKIEMLYAQFEERKLKLARDTSAKIEILMFQFEERKLKQAQKTMFQITKLYEDMETSRMKEDLERNKKWLAAREKMQQKFLFFGLKREELKQAQLKKWYREELQRLETLGLTEQQIEGRTLTMREALRKEYANRIKAIGKGLTKFNLAQLQRMLDDERATVQQKEKIWSQINEKIKTSNISMFGAFKLGVRDAADHFRSNVQIMLQLGRDLANGLNQGLSNVFFDMFDTKITDMTESWEKFGDNLKNIFFKAIADIMAKMASSKILKLAGGLMGGGGGGIGAVVTGAGGLLGGVGGGVANLAGNLIPGVAGPPAPGIGLDPGMLAGVMSNPLALGAMVAVAAVVLVNSGILGKIVDGIVSFVKKIPQVIERFVKKLPEIMQKLVRGVIAIVKQVPVIIKALVKAIPKLIKELLIILPELIEEIMAAIPQIIEDLLDTLPIIVEQLLGQLPDILDRIISALPRILKSILSRIPILISLILNKVPEVVFNILKQLPRILMDILGQLPRILFNILKQLPRILIDILGQLVKILGQLPKILIDILGQLPKILMDILGQLPKILLDLVVKLPGILIKAVSEAIGSLGGVIGGGGGGIIGGIGDIIGFHEGTPLVTKSGLAMIHTGEAIVPAEAVRGGFGGIQGKTIQINAPLVNIEGSLVAGPTEFSRFVKDVKEELTRIANSEF